MDETEAAGGGTPRRFKALGHPMRHRLLSALSREKATISGLAAALGTNKGNVAYHLKVLTDAGLVVPAGTRHVRGGTEQYYRPAPDEPPSGTYEVRRTLRLTPGHAERLVAALDELADRQDADGVPYDLVITLGARARRAGG